MSRPAAQPSPHPRAAGKGLRLAIPGSLLAPSHGQRPSVQERRSSGNFLAQISKLGFQGNHG